MKARVPRSLYAFNGLVILGVLAVLAVLAFPRVRVRYQRWRGQMLAARAMKEIERNELRHASLTVRQSLLLFPQGIEANRAMAVLATRVAEPHAILWWRNVLQLDPSNARRQIESGQASLRFGDVAAAERALVNSRNELRADPSWVSLAAGCAVARRNFVLAGRFFEELKKLQPDQAAPRFNLANVQLLFPDPRVRENAVRQMEQFAADPAFARTALRSLAFYEREIGDYGRSLKCWRQIEAKAPLLWDEKLHVLELQQMADPAVAARLLAECEKQAKADPAALAEMAAWDLARGKARNTLDLLKAVPPSLQNEPTFYFLKAEALLQLKDWEDLNRHLQTATTPSLEFLRSALMACAARNQHSDLFPKHWSVARQLAKERLSARLMLADLAIGWGWIAEAEEMCWELAIGEEAPQDGLDRLARIYLMTKQPRRLRDVFMNMHDRMPEDLIVANNPAALDLLLNEDIDQAVRLAEEVHRKSPSDPSFSVTYGFALYRQGKFDAALKTYAALPPIVQKHPSVALNHALILSANGRRADALKILKTIDARLLNPEEVRLLAEARSAAR